VSAAVGALVVLTLLALAGLGATGLATARLVAPPAGGTARRWPVVLRRWRQHRRGGPEPTDVEVALWCEQVASAVRSGQSLTHAIVVTDRAWAGPPIMPSVAHAVSRGRGLADALDEVPANPATPCGLAVGVLRACARVGGPPASALERVADTLHARGAERAERQAASAQARLSARVLTFVPFAVVAFLALTDASVRSALSSPAGAACLGIGAALNLLGWWWMRRLIGAAS